MDKIGALPGNGKSVQNARPRLRPPSSPLQTSTKSPPPGFVLGHGNRTGGHRAHMAHQAANATLNHNAQKGTTEWAERPPSRKSLFFIFYKTIREVSEEETTQQRPVGTKNNGFAG
eukprot:TRINITY_DN7683_c0_g1_i2.p2 TRINITY_DN7683_c0_g1~~TRINITY_DN7683_c0_g1_i2.p2  ORF type:complete len:116 (-),score=4.28 TRINITY_DN7683_c0_g1_i2:239-586(-)